MGQLPLCEIAYDLLPRVDGTFEFLEGTYRREGGFWKVMIFIPDEKIVRWTYHPTTWESGATGYVFKIPAADQIDSRLVEACLNRVLGPHEWIVVKGPDSMSLR